MCNEHPVISNQLHGIGYLELLYIYLILMTMEHAVKTENVRNTASYRVLIDYRTHCTFC
jgi:hypothetical protein